MLSLSQLCCSWSYFEKQEYVISQKDGEALFNNEMILLRILNLFLKLCKFPVSLNTIIMPLYLRLYLTLACSKEGQSLSAATTSTEQILLFKYQGDYNTGSYISSSNIKFRQWCNCSFLSYKTSLSSMYSSITDLQHNLHSFEADQYLKKSLIYLLGYVMK